MHPIKALTVYLLAAAGFSFAAATPADADEKVCQTYSIALNNVCVDYDGQWQGIVAASDGKCYFGSSSHSPRHGGGFFSFDPRTKGFEVLQEDFTKLVGEDLSKTPPQGKCHSPIIDVDGTLYLSTHLANYWDAAMDKYTGSHILSYNIAAQKWRDYGIMRKRFSTYSAVGVDARLGKIYAVIVPFSSADKKVDGNHLYQVDIKTGEKRDLGRLSKGRGCFNLYIDDKSRVWSSMYQGTGALDCYDPATDKIVTYKDAFPDPLLAPDGKPPIKTNDTPAAWTWAEAIEGGKKCLFTTGQFGGGDERLWLFDPGKDIASKAAFSPLAYVGSTFIGVALGGRRVYYVQRGDVAAQRGYDGEEHRDEPADANGKHPIDFHLKSVSIDPRDSHPFVDHGEIVDQGGRTPGMIDSLAADDKGNVYMNGSWYLIKGDQPTIEFQMKGDKGEYKTLNRGEFFAWVNVSPDLR